MITEEDIILVMTTCPDADSAQLIAVTLLEQRLAACVNTLPGTKSLYRWEGNIEVAEEFVLLIKTSGSRFALIEDTVKKLHPYELPEIISVPIASGSVEYLDWIKQSLGYLL